MSAARLIDFPTQSARAIPPTADNLPADLLTGKDPLALLADDEAHHREFVSQETGNALVAGFVPKHEDCVPLAPQAFGALGGELYRPRLLRVELIPGNTMVEKAKNNGDGRPDKAQIVNVFSTRLVVVPK